ncbi:unnamed protein product [Closterium sp. NIES-65]|nr:unnamed protein product [Closterium sp. NIES-65]
MAVVFLRCSGRRRWVLSCGESLWLATYLGQQAAEGPVVVLSVHVLLRLFLAYTDSQTHAPMALHPTSLSQAAIPTSAPLQGLNPSQRRHTVHQGTTPSPPHTLSLPSPSSPSSPNSALLHQRLPHGFLPLCGAALLSPTCCPFLFPIHPPPPPFSRLPTRSSPHLLFLHRFLNHQLPPPRHCLPAPLTNHCELKLGEAVGCLVGAFFLNDKQGTSIGRIGVSFLLWWGKVMVVLQGGLMVVLQGGLMVVLQGGLMVVLQGGLMVVLQGGLMVVLQGGFMVVLQGGLMVVLQGGLMVVLQGGLSFLLATRFLPPR